MFLNPAVAARRVEDFGMLQTELIPTLDSGATFSPCRKYRYRLWRIWDEVNPVMAWIGLNPSTADESKDDPTIRKCIGFAKRFGFGGIVMLNIFAFRATDPDVMKQCPEPVGPDNDNWLSCEQGRIKTFVAAWGVDGGHCNRDLEVVRIVRDLKCLGLTKDGYPRHPLYMPYSVGLSPYIGRSE